MLSLIQRVGDWPTLEEKNAKSNKVAVVCSTSDAEDDLQHPAVVVPDVRLRDVVVVVTFEDYWVDYDANHWLNTTWHKNWLIWSGESHRDMPSTMVHTTAKKVMFGP